MLLRCLPWIFGALLVTPLRAQEEHRTDERPEIETMLEALAEKIRKSNRGNPHEREAVILVRDLGAQWKQSGDRDRAHIVRGLDRVFLAQRRADKDGVRRSPIYREAARALGHTGDKGASKLSRWIGHPKHKRDIELQRELILALGRTKADEGVKLLAGLIKDDTPRIISAAATALRNFAGKDQKVRKRLFEDLLKATESAQAEARSNNSTAQAIWNTLNGPAQSTMRRLSGARLSGPEAWRRWWNKNKRKDWDGGR